MDITIRTIPHKQQRYDTCGDYLNDDKGNLSVTISDLGDWKREFLVAEHELIEYVLCKIAGISVESIDAFDMAWNEHDGIEEPGDDPEAPYYEQHQIALAYEHSLAVDLGINFKQHDRQLMKELE
jgi:hypothetical protein